MKKKIAIANMLKPVDDVRAFEKIAQSISKTNKYEINIIGNLGKKDPGSPNISFYPHTIVRGSTFKRVQLRWRILLKLWKLRPHLLIITTHELITSAVILRLLRGTKIIYDVQEDFKKNSRYLSNLPIMFRMILAIAIRFKERTAVPFIHQFWLAEACYMQDIHFPRERSLLLENKACSVRGTRAHKAPGKVLFSGTLSDYSGVLLAMKTYQVLAVKMDNPTLLIIGQCHSKKLRLQIEELQKSDPSILLNISERPIPHEEIVTEIFSADLGIISYQENEVNEKKVPTKLYEYARHGLPYLIQTNTHWASEAHVLGGSILIDFSKPDVDFILKKLENSARLFENEFPEDKTWEHHEGDIQHAIETFI